MDDGKIIPLSIFLLLHTLVLIEQNASFQLIQY